VFSGEEGGVWGRGRSRGSLNVHFFEGIRVRLTRSRRGDATRMRLGGGLKVRSSRSFWKEPEEWLEGLTALDDRGSGKVAFWVVSLGGERAGRSGLEGVKRMGGEGGVGWGASKEGMGGEGEVWGDRSSRAPGVRGLSGGDEVLGG